MQLILTILAIEEQMKRGMTKPLRCVADDGAYYIVKFDGEVTIDGLVKEWFGAQLAIRFGLPVPACAIVMTQ